MLRARIHGTPMRSAVPVRVPGVCGRAPRRAVMVVLRYCRTANVLLRPEGLI